MDSSQTLVHFKQGRKTILFQAAAVSRKLGVYQLNKNAPVVSAPFWKSAQLSACAQQMHVNVQYICVRAGTPPAASLYFSTHRHRSATAAEGLA